MMLSVPLKYVIAEKYENIRIKKCISRKKHFLLRGSVFLLPLFGIQSVDCTLRAILGLKEVGTEK